MKNKKQKKTILSALVLALVLSAVLFTVGCSHTSPSFLPYQSQSFFAKATLDINHEKYSVDITKDSGNVYKIVFTSPETLNGVCVEKNGKDISYKFGNVSIPLFADSTLCSYITECFELKKSDMASIKSELYNGTKVNISTFSCSFGELTLILSAETNLPLRIETTVNDIPVILNFSDFTITEE